MGIGKVTPVHAGSTDPLDKLLVGNPKRWVTETQFSHSLRLMATASRLCWSVNLWRVLVGLVNDGQFDGHGVTPTDLSMKSGKPHSRPPHG